MSDQPYDNARQFIISYADLLTAIYAMQEATSALNHPDDAHALLRAHNELRAAIEALEAAADISSSH